MVLARPMAIAGPPRRALPLLLLAACLPGQVRAAPASPAVPAPATTPISASQAQQVLELLNDPQKRAQFAATLQGIVKALPPGEAAALPPAASAAPEAPKLAPDSLGAQVIKQSSSWLGQLQAQTSATIQTLGDFPLLWFWIVRTASDPDSRNRVLQATWKLVAVFGAGLLAEAAAQRLLRRPLDHLEAVTPETSGEADEDTLSTDPDLAVESGLATPGIDTPPATPGSLSDQSGAALRIEQPAADPVDVAGDAAAMPAGLTPALPAATAPSVEGKRRKRRHRTLRSLRRLPFALLRLLLEAIPLGLFFVGASLALGLGLGEAANTRAVILDFMQAYLIVRGAMIVLRTLVSPDRRRLRLIHLSDPSAGYVATWARRLLVVGAFGGATVESGTLFGLYIGAHDALLKLVALVDHVFLVVIVLQLRRPVAARLRARRDRHAAWARALNRLAAVWHWIAIFYIVALWVVWATELRNGYSRLLHFFTVSLAIIIAGRLIGIVALGALDRSVHPPGEAQPQDAALLQTRASRYYPAARAGLGALVMALTALALLEAWGVNSLGFLASTPLGTRIVAALLTVLAALAVAVAVWEAANIALERQLDHLTRHAQLVRAARLRTLGPILRTALLTVLAIVLGLTVLSQIGVNVAPLLAGAGIVGVALGFGSQKLVQDFITGIFLLLENAMQVGDTVTVAGVTGVVETLSIRTLRLRAGDGSVHIIPFSSVTSVNNANRDFANAAVSVGVAYKEDTDRVGAILAEIVADMRESDQFGPLILGEFGLWGVDELGDFAVTVKGQVRTTTGGRWPVQREINRRVKKRFEAEGIEIPFPVRTLLQPDLIASTPTVASAPQPGAAASRPRPPALDLPAA